LDSIDQRMQSFVGWLGEIPQEARRLEDHEARNHAAPWLRHHLGRGIVHSYVAGYELGERWWTLFFERTLNRASDGAEQWWIEAYDCHGKSSSGSYYYLPVENRWGRLQDTRRTVESDTDVSTAIGSSSRGLTRRG
jgi:hypothetical protein